MTRIAETVDLLERLKQQHQRLGHHETAMAYLGAAELVRHIPDVLTDGSRRVEV